ncbi:MAG: hypothetical protein GX683_05265 [Ruminococcaceae bacterium]|nr:hypothetical protein [Oscillospiraceae bacterium]
MADTVTTLKRERAKKRKRRRRQAVGLLTFVLSLLGTATIIFFDVQGIGSLLKEDEDLSVYENLISPLVALDPAPFASIDNGDETTLLEAAIWAALNYEDTTKYTRNEYDAIILPSVDVDKYITKMYGTDYKITHKTFHDLDLEYSFDNTTSCYTIPATSQSGSYIPRVEGVNNSGNTKVLTVAYLQYSGSSADLITTGTDTLEVSKYMEYVMLKNSNGYYLYAIRYPESQPTE